MAMKTVVQLGIDEEEVGRCSEVMSAGIIVQKLFTSIEDKLLQINPVYYLLCKYKIHKHYNYIQR